MVKPEVVGKRVARSTTRLDDAEALLSRPVEDFLADVKGRDLACFYLFLVIEDCIDLAAHWVADAGWGSPDDAGSTFYVLADRQAIERDLAERMRRAVGLRNRIAHGYDEEVDHARIHREFREGVDALRQFLTAVAAEAGY